MPGVLPHKARMLKLLPAIAFAAMQPAASTCTENCFTQEHVEDLRCAAIFAITATEQERGVRSALSYPLLAERGKAFFADTAVRVMAESGASQDMVADELRQLVIELQNRAVEADDPIAVADAVMTPCLSRLAIAEATAAAEAAATAADEDDEEVDQGPDLVDCAAYIRLAADDVEGREGLTPAAMDLRTIESVLDSRAREELRAEGLSGTEIDYVMQTRREEIAAAAEAAQSADEGSTIDYNRCFELAAP